METTTCRLVRAKRGLSSSGVRAIDLPMGAPYAAMGSVGMERSCLWTWTEQGSAKQLGHLGDAWRGLYLGEELGCPGDAWWGQYLGKKESSSIP